ncbi:MAG: hypothetical protein KDC38_20230, partial [Planctomycetes bacterium]|nr:hypothetical protein [Planctomycetota bacterium]
TLRRPWLHPIHALLSVVPRLGPNVDVQWASDHVTDIEAERQLHAIDPLILDRAPLPFLARVERAMSVAQDLAASYPVDVWSFAARNDAIVDTRGLIAFAERVRGARGESGCTCTVVDEVAAHDLGRSSAADRFDASWWTWIESRISAGRR